jgi:hypothetical protein
MGTSQNPSACGLNDGFIQISGLVSGTQYTLNYMLNGVGLTPVYLPHQVVIIQLVT